MTPEKIYIKSIIADDSYGTWHKNKAWFGDTNKYIRKDIMDKAVAEERERCARIAESLPNISIGRKGHQQAKADIAKAIRD